MRACVSRAPARGATQQGAAPGPIMVHSNMATIENAFPELERELDFIPLGVDQPKVLTQEQIQQYNEFGYVAPLSVFNDDEMADIRAYFDELLPRAMDAGWGQYVRARAPAGVACVGM